MKLGEIYNASKDQVSVFGFRTRPGGGKSTGFALIYDSNEALKKYEPYYRLIRCGVAKRTPWIERTSRQMRKLYLETLRYLLIGNRAGSKEVPEDN
jgi:small subunit ribosomal protein S24e